MIEVSSAQIREIENKLGAFKSKAPSVLVRALNRAAENTKANAKRKVREEYDVKATVVGNSFTVSRASRKSLIASAISKSERIPLINFKVNPTKPHPKNPPDVLKVGVKKDSLKAVLGAFIAKGKKSGKYWILMRKGKKRYPTFITFGPAVAQMAGSKGVREYIESEAAKTLDKRIDHEINRVLEGAK